MLKSTLTPLALLTAVLYSHSAAATQAVNLFQDKAAQTAILKQLNTEKLSNSVRALSNDQDLQFVTHSVSQNGKHVRHHQYYKGVRVHGGQIVSHYQQPTNLRALASAASNATSVTGFLVKDISLSSVKPNLSAAKAIDIAKATLVDVLKFDHEESELLIYPSANQYKLVYKVSFYAETTEKPTRPEFIIDANSGDILTVVENLMHVEKGTGPGGNEKIGRHDYGVGKWGNLDITELGGGRCSLENANVKTVDMQNRKWLREQNAFEFNCYHNEYKAVNGAYSPLNDAHYYGNLVFDMYKDWFNTAPLTFQLVMRVHYDYEYQNAFWNGREMTFGDGKDVVYPMTSLNVVAHEVAHGFTDQNSDLIYQNQSGGINEAYSDMAGEAVECFVNMQPDGSCTVDWEIGNKIFKSDRAIRYFKNPERDGVSISHFSKYRDGIDVHYSSGIYNRAFYLLSNSPGWSLKKAFEVMTYANQNFWTANETFESGACNVVEAAKSMGYGSDVEINSIADAFKDVGVYACTGNPAPEISLTSPSDNSRINVGQVNVIQAEASDRNGQVTQVEFFINGQSITKDIRAPFTAQWTPEQLGQYAIYAVATDNEGESTASVLHTVTAIDGSTCTIPEWRADTVYNTNSQVSWEGFVYTAKWWTKGANPAQNSSRWSVWRKGSECGSTAPPKTNTPPTVNFAAPANGSEIELNTELGFNLVASDTDGQIKFVKLYNEDQLVATLDKAPYVFNWTANTVGTFTFSALATDDNNADSQVAKLSVTVKDKAAEPQKPTVELTAPASGTSIELGKSFNFIASASDVDGQVSQVEFYVSGVSVGTANQAPYVVAWKPTQAGSYSVFARATDNDGLSADSTSIELTVKPASSEPTKCQVPAWSSNSVYTKGKKVSLKGTLYEAKWWTRGQSPADFSSTWDVWKNLGTCVK